MIRLSHINVETPMVLDSNSPLTLAVENPGEYYTFVNELSDAFNGEESEFSFWSDDVRILPEKSGDIILSPFFFDATDKKIIALLYKKLQKNYLDGAF